MEHLTKPQLLTLLESMRADNARYWLMTAVGYNHGLRASEIISLTTDNVRDGFITVQRLKGSKKTTQTLVDWQPEDVLNERRPLEELIQALPAKARLFPVTRLQYWRMFQKYGRKAGLPAHLCHPHILKHTTGMAVIPEGIEYCRQYLGHESIASTGAYVNVGDPEACAAARRRL